MTLSFFEEFDFDENAWGNWHDEFVGWLAMPSFSERSDLKALLASGGAAQPGGRV